MAFPELDKLIVEHLADLDASAKRLHQLEKEVFGAIATSAEDWAKKEGWVGGYDYLEGVFWVAPPEWRTPDTEESKDIFQAWFQMGVGADDTENLKPEEDYFNLTRLCRVGSGEIGFRFKQDLITRAKWKMRFRDLTDLVERTAFVADLEPSFFLPFQLEGSKLAETLREEAVEDSLAPFEKALAQIAEARSAFDIIIATIKPAEGGA
jgi:hypothetical protein